VPAVHLSREGLPDAVKFISSRLAQRGYRSWIVGGSVRDSLMAQLDGSRKPGEWVAKDWDLATDAKPEAVIGTFPHVIPTGIAHGTVTVIHKKLPVEVTTLRTEGGYQDGRHPDRVNFVGDIIEDLARRDFTVNAIAVEPDTGAIVDPFSGLVDLERRILRAVGEPERRFAEDGLRILRAARFAATLGFSLEPGTASAMRPSLGTFARVSAERVRDEWVKALKASRPSIAFALMQEHGLLEISAGELERLSQEQPNRWQHALTSVDRAPKSLGVRLAALLADLGAEPKVSGKVAEELLGRLRFSNDEQQLVRHLVTQQVLPIEASENSPELRRFLRTATPALIPNLVELGRARSATPAEDHAILELSGRAARELERGPALTLKQLAVNGQTLMQAGVPRGPLLGRVLEHLLEAVIDEPSRNHEEALLTLTRQWLAQHNNGN
jgi:tRNA nucleotidyltransferase (CCA-adding enzyme)